MADYHGVPLRLWVVTPFWEILCWMWISIAPSGRIHLQVRDLPQMGNKTGTSKRTKTTLLGWSAGIILPGKMRSQKRIEAESEWKVVIKIQGPRISGWTDHSAWHCKPILFWGTVTCVMPTAKIIQLSKIGVCALCMVGTRKITADICDVSATRRKKYSYDYYQ